MHFRLSLCSIFLATFLTSLSDAVESFETKRPNVIIIITDDQGWADIGYNNKNVYTPNLDALAASGAKLVQHYVMPQCTPTRVALMTGRYTGRFGTAGLAASNNPSLNNKGGGYPDNYPLKDYNQPDKLRGKKLDVWEGGIHVSGFINWPGKIQPSKVRQAVHIIDWFPTLANVIGFHPEQEIDWDGLDLSPVLFEEGALVDRDLYWIWSPKINRWA